MTLPHVTSSESGGRGRPVGPVPFLQGTPISVIDDGEPGAGTVEGEGVAVARHEKLHDTRRWWPQDLAGRGERDVEAVRQFGEKRGAFRRAVDLERDARRFHAGRGHRLESGNDHRIEGQRGFSKRRRSRRQRLARVALGQHEDAHPNLGAVPELWECEQRQTYIRIDHGACPPHGGIGSGSMWKCAAAASAATSLLGNF